MNISEGVTRRISDHLKAVSVKLSALPSDERRDILQSVETHIYDALGRTSPDAPDLADLEAVIAGMDPPESYVIEAARERKLTVRSLVLYVVLALATAGVALPAWQRASKTDESPKARLDQKLISESASPDPSHSAAEAAMDGLPMTESDALRTGVLHAAISSSGDSDIMLSDPVSKTWRNLTRGRLVKRGWGQPWEPVGSPDGKTVVLRIYRRIDNREMKTQVWLLDLDTDRLTQIPGEYGFVIGFTWSADSTRFACFQDKSLMVFNRETLEKDIIADAGSRIGHCSWSPGGDRVAYACSDGALWVADAAEGTSTRLVGSGVADGAFCWGPDGRQIAATISGLISLVSLDGQLIREFGQAGSVHAWSRDGKFLAYESRTGGMRKLHILSLGDGSSVPVNYDRDATGALWIPKSNRLVFWGREDSKEHRYSLFMANADGSNPQAFGKAHSAGFMAPTLLGSDLEASHAEAAARVNVRRITDKIDYPFVNDTAVTGSWVSVDFVSTIQEFTPEKKSWRGGLHLKELVFLPGGKMTPSFYVWTKGLVMSPKGKTASKYVIKSFDDVDYMFFEWKSGDYTIRGRKPAFYVLRRRSASGKPRGGSSALPKPVPFARSLRMCAISTSSEQTGLSVGFVDRKQTPPRSYYLQEGNSEDGIELARADFESQRALVRKGREGCWTSMRGPASPRAISRKGTDDSKTSTMSLRFDKAPAHVVLRDYEEKTGFVLLVSPELPESFITLTSESLTTEAYLQIVETALLMHGIRLVKIGDRLAKALPCTKDDTQEATPTPLGFASPPKDNEAESIRVVFQDATLDVVLDDYRTRTALTMIRAPELPKVSINLRIVRGLSLPEYVEAVESLLEMHGVKIVKSEDKVARVIALHAPTRLHGYGEKPAATAPRRVPESVNIDLSSGKPPVVVSTYPKFGDLNVDPNVGRIAVTFDREMLRDRMWSWCYESRDTFPELSPDTVRYVDERTSVAEVELEPDKTYVVWFNTEKFTSFRDRYHKPAVPYRLEFKTGNQPKWTEEDSPATAARRFFEACRSRDWEEALTYWHTVDAQAGEGALNRLKDYLGGVEILRIGKPFKKIKNYPGWHVPYKIRLRGDAPDKEYDLAIRNDLPDRGWIIDGGI